MQMNPADPEHAAGRHVGTAARRLRQPSRRNRRCRTATTPTTRSRNGAPAAASTRPPTAARPSSKLDQGPARPAPWAASASTTIARTRTSSSPSSTPRRSAWARRQPRGRAAYLGINGRGRRRRGPRDPGRATTAPPPRPACKSATSSSPSTRRRCRHSSSSLSW